VCRRLWLIEAVSRAVLRRKFFCARLYARKLRALGLKGNCMPLPERSGGYVGRFLLPDDPDNYYRTRELLPPDMLGDIAKAKIVITNFHAFKRREIMEVSKVGGRLA
jgi:hypothetical protein